MPRKRSYFTVRSTAVVNLLRKWPSRSRKELFSGDRLKNFNGSSSKSRFLPVNDRLRVVMFDLGGFVIKSETLSFRPETVPIEILRSGLARSTNFLGGKSHQNLV